ncbi:hypothetical protein FIU86_00645 [Roseovarius sp. THAF9]|nr:hypothetical protein FIU86_00645 [Roseovarius sp. THAF9]
MKSCTRPTRAAPGPKPGMKIHNQFLPADRATQILLQQFL